MINRSTELFHGVRPLIGPGNHVRVSVDDEPLTEAERLRVVYTLIASPVDGGRCWHYSRPKSLGLC